MAFPNHLEDKVDIIFKCKEKDTVPLRNLGFVDKKATKTFKPLESLILLKQFAKDKNKYSFPLSTGSERGKLYAQVDSLRKVLKQCFGIDGDPVPTIKGGGYRLLFNAYCYDTEEILEVDTFLDSLNGYFSKLSTGSYRDNDRIKEIVEVIQAIANEIIQRIPGIRIKNAVCTGCYQKVQSYDLNTDTIQMLCNECTPEPSNEYKSKSVVDYKDNDISRSK